MTVQTLFPDADGHAIIVCAHCGAAKSVPVAQFRAFVQPHEVQCPCSATFFVRFEARKFYRQPTRLHGTYSLFDASHPAGITKGPMLVEDLSQRGLGFRTALGHPIRVNAGLLVQFVLDDQPRTRLRKSAVVRHVDAQYIGAEFLDFASDGYANRMLGLYLLSTSC